MSRTTRKRRFSFFKEYEWWFEYQEWNTGHWDNEYNEELLLAQAKYYTDLFDYYRSNPNKPFRKNINKQRRSRDKRELYKEINLIGYEGLYDLWNCKTANREWYW